MDNEQLAAITAFAAVTSAVVATLAFLEARAVRVATRDSAAVVARLRYSEDRSVFDVLYLENLGPNIARDVRMKVLFVDRDGVVQVEDEVRISVLAPGQADRQAFLPQVLLAWEDPETVPSLDDLVERGLSLEIELDWLDDRRWLGLPFLRRRHGSRDRIDIAEYLGSTLRSMRVMDPTLTSEIRELRAAFARQWRAASIRATEGSAPEPDDGHPSTEEPAPITIGAPHRVRIRPWTEWLRSRLDQ
jgi:hypothetical protein